MSWKAAIKRIVCQVLVRSGHEKVEKGVYRYNSICERCVCNSYWCLDRSIFLLEVISIGFAIFTLSPILGGTSSA